MHAAAADARSSVSATRDKALEKTLDFVILSSFIIHRHPSIQIDFLGQNTDCI